MPRSRGEEQLAEQLDIKEIPYQREFQFIPPRRFRFDFIILPVGRMLACEVEGGAYTGGHKRGKANDTDCEKFNLPMLDGWAVLRFTPGMVTSGEALTTIQNAIDNGTGGRVGCGA